MMKFPFMYVIVLSAVFIFLESCNSATSSPSNNEQEIVSVKAESDEVDSDYNPEAKLSAMGIQLKSASSPIANYVNAVRSGNLIFLSGKGPLQSNGENITGKVGTDLTIEQGYEAARITGNQPVIGT